MFVDIPSRLRAVDFVVVRFQLAFRESCSVGLEAILRLRRDLHQAGRQVLGSGERFSSLFDPPLPVDPEALRRHQRPGPAFVIHSPEGLPAVFGPGDDLILPVVFLGAGVQRLADFIRVLRELGRMGLHRGEGRFELEMAEAESADRRLHPVWRTGEKLEGLSPPLLDVRWWLETSLPTGSPILLKILTPARLLTGGRPLFRPSFVRIFPFLLRRVTSMLYAHCGIEAADSPAVFLEAAARVAETENRLVWEDWRVLERGGGRLDLGGLVGDLRLEGEDLGAVYWILGLASLLNLGRGASFGAGSLSLCPIPFNPACCGGLISPV